MSKKFFFFGNNNAEQQMDITGLFDAGQTTLRSITIDALLAGTYTAFTDDGSSGDVELSINGGAYAAFSGPLTLDIGDTLEVQRSVTTGSGYYTMSGTIHTRVLSFEFGAIENTSDTLTIDANSAGTYTMFVDDGASGTITYSKNAAAYVGFSGNLTLSGGDTITIKRTVTTSSGYVRLYGN